jgi:hypothetical protein
MKTILALAVALLAGTAWAQSTNPARQTNWTITCADTDYVIDFLKEYEERPVLTGNLGRAGKMAVLINTDTGTWTLIGYTERGACIMASGDNVQQLEPTKRNRQ